MTSPLIVLERAVLLHEHFDAAGIAHALGGALALAYHVQDARGTSDIDVNVTCDAERASRVFSVLPMGLPWTSSDVAEVARTGQIRLLWPHPDGAPTQPIPVDLFFPQHDFHAVVASRTEVVAMLATTVPIISATDLTIFKCLFDRSKDWPDIEELLRFGRVDVPEVESWLVTLLGEDDPRLGRLATLVESTGAPRPQVSTAELFGRRKPRLGD